MKKMVLGRGLEALIPTEESSPEGESRVRSTPLDRIAPNPLQPRREFNETTLQELAESLKQHGIMQPLVVRKNGSGFTIIAGERRYRAAQLAGLEKVPVVVRDDIDESLMLELALVENLQREDLNPLDEAEAYRKLIDRCDYTQSDLAKRLGKSRAVIANGLRLLNLPDRIKQLVRGGQLTEGHARSILALSSEDEMLRLANRILDESLSVRAVERITGGKRRGRPARRKTIPALVEAESRLRQLFGTAVRIRRGRKRSLIEIEFYSDDDLNRLLDILYRTG